MAATETYLALKPGSTDIYQDAMWWNAWQREHEAHEILIEYVDRMKGNQATRYTNWRKLISIFEWGFRSAAFDSVQEAAVDESLNAYNAAQNVIETVHSKICKSRIVPMPLTSGGGYLQRKRAKDLQKALEGEFDENNVDQIKEDVVMDALVLGAGFAKVFCEWGKIKIEHVPTEDIVVDDGEGRQRRPRSMYQVTKMDRFVVLEQYGGEDSSLHGEKAVRRTKILSCPCDSGRDGTTSVQQDQIRIVEAWHLPSRPLTDKEDDDEEEANDNAAKHDGRHVIAIDGCTLVDEPWERSCFPFAAYIPRKRRRSFWGLSAMHALAAPQNEFERTTAKIQQAFQKMSGGHFLVPTGANVNVRSMDNDFGTVLEFDGPQPPQEWNPSPVSPQMFEYQNQIPSLMLQHMGVSAMSTSSQIPAGLQQASGKALQVFDDVEAERLRAYHSELDRWHVDLAALIILEARELTESGEAYTVRYRGKKAIEEVDWKKVLVDESEFVLKVFPISILARSPAAKFEQLQEMLNAGAITVEQFRRLFELPDLEAENEIDSADTDIVDRNLDIIVVEGRYLSPEPFDNLQLAKTRASKFYNVCRANQVPDDKLELLRNYISDCDALTQQAASASAPPGGAPAPGPGMPPGAASPLPPPGATGPMPPPPMMPPGMPPMAA